ncbi:tetratricopeptide repeat protein [Archangium violaceum]|uniref:CHAT domain-containing tetratricopeptide repeat protein n=1 Tax=Archangium violaceum TaxID=83451 RepID=UPI00193B9A1A|nr:tetratricopeptide repeat protein [Archangium violaceum]QRK06183.1 tetratricopeptide repeat protein [Archangium violaceum]
MWRSLGWMILAVLCCTANVAAGEVRAEARLLEAQAAFDEANELQAAGQYTEALRRSQHALTLREAVLGGEHPEVATSLSQLGDLYLHPRDTTRARPLLERALAIQERTLGGNHPDVARTLNSLGVLLGIQGAYGQATQFHERALSIRETALGKHHPDLAQTLISLASAYQEQGSYGQAEPLVQRALAIQEAAFGGNDPQVAASLNTLALLYRNQKQYARAEPLLERALAIREVSLGQHHPDVASTLNDLASVHYYQRAYARAEPLYKRALAIREAALGKNHPDVGHTYNNLGLLYAARGSYARAEPLYKRALTIWETSLGKHHPTVAAVLDNLATLCRNRRLYARAEPLYRRALAIREATLGRNHPQLIHTIVEFARLRLAQDRLADAIPLFMRAFTLSEEYLREEALDLSESRQLHLLQFLHTDEERLYSLLWAHPDDARVRHLALTAVLLRKGRSIEETSNTSRIVYRGLGAQDREQLEQLRAIRSQLATLALQGPGSLAPAEYQRRLEELASQGDILETGLVRRSAPLRALISLPPPAEMVERVAAALPQDAALVELVAYAHRPLIPESGPHRAESAGPLRYLALVLFPSGRIRALDLGPAAPIDLATTELCNAFSSRDAAYQHHARTLYSLAFRPLLPLLGDVRRLFIAPDGQLGLVPFHALHDGHDFLIERFDFTRLTSGRDLLPRPQRPSPSRSVVVFAAPSFEATQGTGSPWAPLPGTRQEALAIQRLLPQTQLFLGHDATRERLFQVKAPGILHIATHGFFLENTAAPADSRALIQVGAADRGPSPRRPSDPLLRSGLVLTSAPVTALELASLDLWGTELVVLSACDTGRGDVRLGQGIYGLSRALVTAGAETVVSSLWKVNDATTQILMEDYYRHLLAGKGRAAALREAMRALRRIQPHPYYWAPFIALGRDTPLRALAPNAQTPSAGWL